MSSLHFKIDDWIQGDDPDPRRACTSSELVILVDDIPVTRLFDSWSRTVTDRARLPLYPLAEWFAANWWRLHAEAPYEGGDQPPADWLLSHELTAIGGGFVWPRVRFASDDIHIQISARASRNAPWEPVRHLNEIRPAKAVPVESFDRAVDGLIDTVLCRLADLDIPADPLANIWSDVLAERADPEVVEWRRWEARLGYDPDEAPDDLIEQIFVLFGKAGKSATAEVAPFLSPHRPVVMHQLEALAAAPGVEATLPLGRTRAPVILGRAPWDAGRTLAHKVRDDIGQKSGPLDNRVLHDVLGTTDVLARTSLSELPIGLGVYVRDQENAVLHFTKRNPAGVRFEAARFLAESLSASREDLWLPLTNRATARQKFQRAFAIEFLAPIDEIAEQVGEVRTADRFEDVADRYGVSPLAIRSHLANHGLLSMEEVVI